MLPDLNLELENKLENFLLERVGTEDCRPGLERIRSVCGELIDSIQRSHTQIVIVGGTNGKGQTCRELAHILDQRSQSFCLWTSPHVLSVRERFQSSRAMISYAHLETLLRTCWKQMKMQQVHLSYYEFLFWAFLQFVVEQRPDVMILEVGLGGRLDAVNVFDADVTAVASLSRDHQAILGESYKAILYEKLAIGRRGHVLISAFELSYLRNLTEEYTRTRQICWVDLFEQGELEQVSTYEQRNICLAQQLASYLKTTPASLSGGKISQSLPPLGRGEKMTLEGISFIFRGAHNLDGVRKMVYSELQTRATGSTRACYDLILFSPSDRAIQEILVMCRLLAENVQLTENFLLTQFEHFKAFKDFESIEAACPQIQFSKAWFTHLFGQRQRFKRVLVTGSYFFISDVYKKLLSLH